MIAMPTGETGPDFSETDETPRPYDEELELGGFKHDLQRVRIIGAKGGKPSESLPAELPEEEHESDQTAE